MSVVLHALTAEEILVLADGGTVAVEGVEVTWPDGDERMLRYRREALAQDAGSAPYLVHVVVEGGAVVGRIGCHEGPRGGLVEIGYAVVPTHRRRGLATAMVGEFLRWLAVQGVTTVRASVSPDNVASRAVLDRFGFVETGSHVDDEDGLEIELSLSLSDR